MTKSEFRQRKGAIIMHYLQTIAVHSLLSMVMTDAKRHHIRVAKSEEKLDYHFLRDGTSRYETSTFSRERKKS
jgi:hypothetical protein